MDAKELRTEAVLTERSNDGGVKFAVQYDRTKCEAGASARPCAVIGPDRVVLPARDALKKPAEPWLAPEPGYRRLPDYPYKMPDHKDPTRNISPRQTFQENMQRIIMPPGYNAPKLHEDPAFASKNKLNSPLEVKYCDVPYNINQVSSDQKHIRNADHSANVNPLLMRGVAHGWPAGSVHVRPLRTYGAAEGLQYADYANCMGPRPMLTRNHAAAHDDQLYPDAYYHESNIRFKPYPPIKERYPQTRYEYLGNYPNPYHPPNPFAHKYELPKTIPPQSYSGYPQLPKYTERIPEPIMDGYQRPFSQQGNYGVPIRNPVIHSPYRPVHGNHMQNKLHPYPPDGQHKPVPNKLPYDPSSKMYLDYDKRAKPMSMTDNYYVNELPRSYHPKNTIVLPNFASPNIHGANAHPCYPLKNYDYTHYIDPSMRNHSLTKLPPQFSPGTLAISPADSNASNETVQTHGTSQEDCGYASQSSVASARSIESLNRIPMDVYGRYDYRYSPIIRASPSTKPGPSSNQGSKSKKDIRQFISSWSEGDEENADSAKKDGVKTTTDDKHSFNKQYETVNNQEQLYVLGLVNVPSEELSKYEHIQKVSKLPENIKGYNSLELLNQFEEAIESSNISNIKPPTPRAVQMPIKRMLHKHDPHPVPRALSPLDVEAKISQSVIHKEVGCNFEIKPCSPKMLNVEVATPLQNLLNERVIEKVSNPHNVKSPIMLQGVDENIEKSLIAKTMKCPVPNTASSCKMINSQHLPESSGTDHLKTNYSLQDLESNSGVCLASLPRLDNDIELNFPEVNQQFINANKTDSVITSSLAKELPASDVDRSSITSSEYEVNYQFSPKIETESDFSRLSKYRKLKRCAPNDHDSALAKAQATRVDSVIIKNPDNTRCLDDNADNNPAEGNFRKDLQDYAMNLVSQTKISRTHLQHDVDKMFETSTNPSIASRFDDISTQSPNTEIFAMNLSSSSLNEHLNVAEQSNRNDTVHSQSEDFTIHSKGLSNRYFEKAALDTPMNLSPQAKFSTIGVEEEIIICRSGGNTASSDGKQQCARETNNLKEYEEKEPKNIGVMSLDKIEDTLMKAQAVNIIDTSEIQSAHKEPTTKSDITGNCPSTLFIKRDDVDIGKHDDFILNTDSHASTMCSDEERNKNKKINDTNVETELTDKANRGDDVCHESGHGGCNSITICTNKVKVNIDNVSEKQKTFKKYDRSISKMKRKKKRSEGHRKRCLEKVSHVNMADVKVKNQNVTMLLNTDQENPTENSINREPHITLEEGENNIQSHTNSDTEVIKENLKLSSLSDLVDISTQLTNKINRMKKKSCTENSENILQNDPDVIRNSISPFCLRTRENSTVVSKITENAMNETAQNNLPMDIDSDTSKHYENCKLSMQANLIVDGQQEIKSFNNDPLVKNLTDEQINSGRETSLHGNTSITFEPKELEIPVFSDQLESQSKNAYLENKQVNLENKHLDVPGLPDINDKKNKGSITDILNFDMKKHSEISFSNANETMSRELKPLENKEFEHERENISKDFQIHGHLGTISSNNEDRCRDYPLLNNEANRSTPRSEYQIKTNFNEEATNRENDIIILGGQQEIKCFNNNSLVTNFTDEQINSERETSLHGNTNIQFKPKELETPVFLDQLESQNGYLENKQANIENKHLDVPGLPDINDKKINKGSITDILNFDMKKHSEIRFSDANETMIRERKPPENKEFEHERETISKDFQIYGHLGTISSNNKDRCRDYPLLNNEANHSTPRFECQHKTDFNQEVTNRGNGIIRVCRPHVKKELFSSRFQNLLFSNENIDIFSGASKTKIPDKPSLGKVIHHVTQNQTICATEETGMNTVLSIYPQVSDEKNVTDLDLTRSFDSNLINESGTPRDRDKQEVNDTADTTTLKEEYNKVMLGNETNCTLVENCIFFSDCNNVDNALGLTENYGNNEINNPCPLIQSKMYDETQSSSVADSFKKSVGQFVSKSSCDDVSTECDENLGNYSRERESDSPMSNNVESDTCTTNIMVVDETTCLSPEYCHEFNEVDTPTFNNYEFSKNIQSFAQNITAKSRFSLKRSLSDSALNVYVDECLEKNRSMLPRKRKKISDIGKIDESHLLKIIQSSRRNSISTLDNENFSFCILIDDNCIVAEENYDQENFVQIEGDLLNHPLKDPEVDDEKITSPVYNLVHENMNGPNPYVTEYDEEKTWVEDVGCEETIETEDIAENIVIGDPASPKDADSSDYESDDESIDDLNNAAVDHTSKVKHIYGDNMCTNDSLLVDALYRTPQMDVNKKLLDRESHITDKSNRCYDSDSLEMLLAEPVDNIPRADATAKSNTDYIHLSSMKSSTDSVNNQNSDSACAEIYSPDVRNLLTDAAQPNEKNIAPKKSRADTIIDDKTQDGIIHSCESSLDNVFSYMQKEDSSQCSHTTSSSPEVSSTTSEERNSSILLKISNFKGSRISEVKSLSSDKQKQNNYKTEEKEYLKLNCSDGMPSNRPLRTKAAQKYIPPLRESIPDLKVKLALPQQSLLKFQKNKEAKEEPKLCPRNIYSSNNNSHKLKNEILPRKMKPKFEDVLKNIDEAQFQMQKEKNKKAKKYIPKVVIKKSENGSHYASTSTKETFNPDLTGRKWQPWVFIEKNKFIDDMALKNKTRAVFSHRRKTFVLAEKFCKYKSISSAKFVISQPKLSDFSTGNLKYTIKLKHGY